MFNQRKKTDRSVLKKTKEVPSLSEKVDRFWHGSDFLEKTEHQKKQYKRNTVIALIGLALILVLMAIFHYIKSQPREMEDILPTMQEALDYQVAVADQSKVFESVEAQIGEKDYNAFLGIKDENSNPEIVKYVERKYADSVYESQAALDDVAALEEQVRQQGGLVTLADLEQTKVGTGLELDRPLQTLDIDELEQAQADLAKAQQSQKPQAYTYGSHEHNNDNHDEHDHEHNH